MITWKTNDSVIEMICILFILDIEKYTITTIGLHFLDKPQINTWFSRFPYSYTMKDKWMQNHIDSEDNVKCYK